MNYGEESAILMILLVISGPPDFPLRRVGCYTATFFVRTFCIRLAQLHKVKLDTLGFCSYCSASIPASEQEERGVVHAIGRSAEGIHQLSAGCSLVHSLATY
jgi:hypothetical protein